MLERILSKLFPHELIGGEEYHDLARKWGICEHFHRWTLLHWPWNWRDDEVFLHKFVGSDWGRDPHDHPRPFWSIGLWGRYTEIQYLGCVRSKTDLGKVWWETREREYRAPWIRRFRAEHRHRIVMREGETCWTLVILFKKVRPWGFWVSPTRWVKYDDYIGSDAAQAAARTDC